VGCCGPFFESGFRTPKSFKNSQFQVRLKCSDHAILSWYALEANQEHDANSSGDKVTDEEGGDKRKGGILGTPCRDLFTIKFNGEIERGVREEVGRRYVMGGGLKDMISSYSNSFSCSRLISSLCTGGRHAPSQQTIKETMVARITDDQIRRIQGRGVARRARRRDHAVDQKRLTIAWRTMYVLTYASK
jgi:hypothetical protein